MKTCSNGRKFDRSVTDDVKDLLTTLVDKSTDSALYKETMFKIGHFMGKELSKKLDPSKSYCVASTVEDADFLSKGIIEGLKGVVKSVYLVCFWNDRMSVNGQSVAPIYNRYLDEGFENSESLIVVKSIISGSCVVKTNITAIIDSMKLNNIFVLAPVMHKDSQIKLEMEFPLQVSALFNYFSLAIDDYKNDSGEVLPGIGGSVYERLGFSGQAEKNTYMPQIIQERMFSVC
jgi:uracil phosphoribosyltransferase